MGRVVALLTAAVLTLTLGSVTAAPAEAAPGRTKVTWSFTTSDVDVTVAPSVSYTVKRERRGVKAYLQQLTAAGWSDVTRLKGKGTVTLPLQAMGEHQFRVQIRSKVGGKRKRATDPQTLRVYSGVPLADLVGHFSQQSGTTYLGGQPFAYTVRLLDKTLLFIQSRSSCSQLTLYAGASRDVEVRAFVAGEEVGEPVVVPGNTLPPALTYTVRPGDRFLVRADTAGSTVYLNGFAYCYTADGEA